MTILRLLLEGAIRVDKGKGHRFYDALHIATPDQLRQALTTLEARRWLAYRDLRIREIRARLKERGIQP